MIALKCFRYQVQDFVLTGCRLVTSSLQVAPYISSSVQAQRSSLYRGLHADPKLTKP